MDSRLASEIEFYVKEGVTNVREMKRLVGIFVKNNLFAGTELPKNFKFNRRFNPKKNSIRSKMLRVIRENRSSNLDQVCLKRKIAEWEREDSSRNIYFREKLDQSQTQNISDENGDER